MYSISDSNRGKPVIKLSGGSSTLVKELPYEDTKKYARSPCTSRNLYRRRMQGPLDCSLAGWLSPRSCCLLKTMRFASSDTKALKATAILYSTCSILYQAFAVPKRTFLIRTPWQVSCLACPHELRFVCLGSRAPSTFESARGCYITTFLPKRQSHNDAPTCLSTLPSCKRPMLN